jgi:hypothetical protein
VEESREPFLEMFFDMRACDFFELFVFSACPTGYISPSNKAVILSEALRRSIANRGLYGAQSKDPGHACWQMLLGAFHPQTTTEDKKSQARSGEICCSHFLQRVTFRVLLIEGRAAKPDPPIKLTPWKADPGWLLASLLTIGPQS